MNELVQMIAQKTGLAQDKAQMIVDMVVTHLKGKLPSSVSSHLDSFLGKEINVKEINHDPKTTDSSIYGARRLNLTVLCHDGNGSVEFP